MKKIKAFTLVELLIGMILSSLIIGFSMQIFLNNQRMFESYRSGKINVMKAINLQSLLQIDAFEARTITFKENMLSFIKTKDQISYQFDEQEIIRKGTEVSDTFLLQPMRIEPLKAENTDLVTAFHLQALEGDLAYDMSFHKTYDAATLMNSENNEYGNDIP